LLLFSLKGGSVFIVSIDLACKHGGIPQALSLGKLALFSGDRRSRICEGGLLCVPCSSIVDNFLPESFEIGGA
jgi:hypothetical protein